MILEVVFRPRLSAFNGICVCVFAVVVGEGEVSALNLFALIRSRLAAVQSEASSTGALLSSANARK